MHWFNPYKPHGNICRNTHSRNVWIEKYFGRRGFGAKGILGKGDFGKRGFWEILEFGEMGV